MTGSAPSAVDPAARPVFVVEGLSVEFGSRRHPLPVVSDLSLSIGPGETLGLVGESGSGKTVTALAALGLIKAQGGRIVSGRVELDGTRIDTLPEKQLAKLRGAKIGMIFQQPTRSLNPAFTVGEHIAETLRRHERLGRRQAWARAVQLLDRVHIPNAARRASDYPHQFSGGMCQRVAIAIAIACGPKLLIADEPTTALDVTVQAVVLDLLREIQRELDLAILFISHDLGVIAEMCDRVVVMYAGEAVEMASADRLFVSPTHPYTAGLLQAVPVPDRGRELYSIPGGVPLPGQWPRGCRFHNRCEHVVSGTCDTTPIAMVAKDDGASEARCARASELTLTGITIPGVSA